MEKPEIGDLLLKKHSLMLLEVPDSIYNLVCRESKIPEDKEIAKLVIIDDKFQICVKKDYLPSENSHNFDLINL